MEREIITLRISTNEDYGRHGCDCGKDSPCFRGWKADFAGKEFKFFSPPMPRDIRHRSFPEECQTFYEFVDYPKTNCCQHQVEEL